MRGGTSKGVFVRDEALPPAGPRRDELLLALMGSPDPMQIDGLGGTHSSTSKVLTVSSSSRPQCDLDYTFYQVGIERAVVDAGGNCGNLTAAVGPYAIDEGILAVVDGTVDVRLFNTNTQRRIVARVPVENRRFAWSGDYHDDGVPGTPAPIHTDYLDPAGAVTGHLFPTRSRRARLAPQVGDVVEVSIVDVTAPVVMIAGDQLGLSALTDPSVVNADPALLERIESIRAAAAVVVGLASDEGDARANSAALPRVAVLDRAHRHELVTGRVIEASDHDLVLPSMSMQRAHHAIPLTTALCIGAAAQIPGTVAHELCSAPRGPSRLAHPKGVLTVRSSVDLGRDGPHVVSVGVTRTARCLLTGIAHIGRSC